jgi:hypothetical protein
MSVTVTKTEQTVEVTQDNQTVTVTPVTQTIEVSAAGPQGATGATGSAATIVVGTTTTGAAGTSASVTNSGTSSAATFNFTIPQGTAGTNGTNGQGVPVGGTTGQVLAKIDGTDYNTQWSTPATGGVTSVTGTAPIVSSGGTTPAISVTAGSTSASGVVQLSDSVSIADSTVAATSAAVKTAYDAAGSAMTVASAALASIALQRVLYGSTTANATHLRNELTTTNTNTSGQVILTRIYVLASKTITNISVTSGATASASLTYCAFAIYTRSGTTFTRVARTSSDTTIFNTANTKYTRTTTTSPTLNSAIEYYIGILQVGTTMATTLAGTARADTSANAATGVQVYTVAGQTILDITLTGVANGTRSDHAEVN